MQIDPAVLIGGAVTVAAGGVIWFFKNTMGRISATEKEKVSREEFETHLERAEISRRELRESQTVLFRKVDDLRDHVDEKFDRLTTLIQSK